MTLTEFLLARMADWETFWRTSWSEHPLGERLVGVMLTDCEAKRQIVALHHDSVDEDAGGSRFSTGCAECGGEGFGEAVEWPCPTLRLLALPYADHPDYDEGWRP